MSTATAVATTLRSKILGAAPSNYESIVNEAIGLHRELEALSGEPLVAHHASLRSSEKLSGPAFLREALRIAKTSTGKLEELRDVLDADPDQYPLTLSFVGETSRRVAEVRNDLGALAMPPSTNLAALMPGTASQEAFLGVTMECLAAGSTAACAMALAVMEAVRSAPKSVFGSVEDLAEQRNRSEKLREQLWRLCDQIPAHATTVWTWSDEGESLARVTYQWHGADTQVPVGPLLGSGMRLVQALAAG